MTIICAVLCAVTLTSGCSRIEGSGNIPDPDPADSLSANQETDESSYIYSSLTQEERSYYDILKDAVYNYEEEAVFPKKLSPDMMRKLFVAVYYNEEGLFWLTSMFYRPAENSDRLKLTYRFDREASEKMQEEIDARTAEIFSGFDESTSDYEKLLAFHDSIVLGCTFNMGTEYGNTIYGVLCDGYAQCEGYAFTFDYLCKLAGIDCYTVTGTNLEGESHAWNIVKLDGEWYHVDCTWDDPILDPPDTEFIRYYYFLVSDYDIAGVTHIPDSSYFTLPLCTAKDNYYVRENYVASEGEQAEDILIKAAADSIAKGRKDIAVRFANRAAYDDAMVRLFDRKGIRSVFRYANSISDRSFEERKYVRYCNSDELIIHITMIYA